MTRQGILRVRRLLWVPVRCRHGHGPEHWSQLKKKKLPKDKALEHFDDFYATVYGDMWPNIRRALLKKTHKYVAVVNNFSDTEKIIENLQVQGAMDVKQLYEVTKRSKEERDIRRQQLEPTKPIYKIDLPEAPPIEAVLAERTKAELKSLFPESYEPPEKLLQPNQDDEDDDLPKKVEPLEPVQLRPLEEDLELATPDESRIIRPDVGLTSSSLHEYVPATKLKGLDDYVLESDHYGYYAKSADFAIKVEKDANFTIPENLKIFTFAPGDDGSFATPKKSYGGVSDYYLMDGGSILPVLALDLQAGDVVLDMCAAPGGKSLVVLQTLLPCVLVANDHKPSRVNLINNVFEEFLGELDLWSDRLFVTQQDARVIEDKNVYNKILVDVPCTTDRHNLYNDENNIFSPARIKERLQLPEYQAAILVQALKILPIGGTVVYSTCSLSPIQNDGVVQMALKENWEQTQSTMVVKDISDGLGPLSTLYKFGRDFGFKYGTIVIPTKKANFGPMYFSKIVRVQ